MAWSQVYDPLNNMWLSTLLGAIPIVVLLGAIGLFEIRAHIAAALGLLAALAIAVIGFGMPAGMAGATALYGAAYGLLPIGWIILNVIFLYRLTEEAGLFTVLRDSIASITRDRRLLFIFAGFTLTHFINTALILDLVTRVGRDRFPPDNFWLYLISFINLALLVYTVQTGWNIYLRKPGSTSG